MDSVVSWFMAVVLSLIGSVWFINKAEEEKRRNRRENDDFFIKKKIQDDYKRL